MQQYFIEDQVPKTLHLDGGEIHHHLRRVMRAKVNDELIVCQSGAACFLMRIQTMTDSHATLERVHAITTPTHPLFITLFQGLIKRTPFEISLQKAAELGVARFVPLKSARSIIKIDDAALSKKTARYQTIAKEASEQSHRGDVMRVDTPIDITSIDVDAFDYVIVPYEGASGSAFKSLLKQFKPGTSVAVVIGPEGGFTPGEIDTLCARGAHVVSLGSRILRSESAALFTLSAINYETELDT